MTVKEDFIPLETVRIDEEGFHLMLKAVVNKKEVRLLLDTGASRTVFDKSRLIDIFGKKQIKFKNVSEKSVGLGTKSMKSQMAIFDEFALGNISFADFTVVVLDLNHVNYSYQMIGDEGVAGVLGSDLLVKYKANIDLKNNKLKFRKK
jgi:predicted aspartyl protease